ncbi:IS481 family transposase [Mesorhizobium amorphae]|uniref:helix-turn-helix domain-containing protein n=1 Tax=Mesorhizobium amorphae TaxID=71433 RepID=UPI00235CA30E|nr:helix-turn-helix domain-containing protein [Mesorhizobium amorphae]GLR45652.1 IS481 family transposase [Mesorhizobium amorphae]
MALARQRLGVLELAATLGNVAEACRRYGIDRTSFYAWRSRFREQGLTGLKDRSPVHHNHPLKTPRKTASRVAALALQHPAYGCNRLQVLLHGEGMRLSAVTVQKLLRERGLGCRRQRWLTLEALATKRSLRLTAEQAAFVEASNPSFRERYSETQAPGEVLCANILPVSRLRNEGKIFLCFVVDIYCAYTFAALKVGWHEQPLAELMQNVVVPFYGVRQLVVREVIASAALQCGEVEVRDCAPGFATAEIKYHATRLRPGHLHGFAERFGRIVSGEFFCGRRAAVDRSDMDGMQTELRLWLEKYNAKRSLDGYRNYGTPPAEMMDRWLAVHVPAN